MQNALPKNIQNFIGENKVAGVCFVDEKNQPYCISCFYAFDEAEMQLIFKSSYGTKHETLIKAGCAIAGTILPDKIEMTGLKGIQFSGNVKPDFVLGGSTFNATYAKAFPMSLMLPGYFWILQLTHIKFTDNTLGFGNKTIWNRL